MVAPLVASDPTYRRHRRPRHRLGDLVAGERVGDDDPEQQRHDHGGHGDRAFDEVFMQKTFDTYWARP